MLLADAVSRYHDWLSHGSLAADSQEWLERLTEKRGLYFGNRPVCTVLRPRFLTASQYHFLQQRVRILLSAFRKVFRRALVDRDFRTQFGLLDWEEELLQLPVAFDDPSPTARLDSFFVSEVELKFTEFNTETPAGAAYHDILSDLFLTLPILREFLRHYEVRPLPARPGVWHALLASWQQAVGSTTSCPRIAILDWREVPTYSEFRLYEDYFRSLGVECRIIDPRDVEFVNGKLWHGDFPIDLIYKRVLVSELYERGGMQHPVFEALRHRAVYMVNDPRCKILYKKASLAVLSDESNASMWNDVERNAIRDHIPWTRRVEERRTAWNGQTIDLVPYVIAHRDQFVLKPNDEYGGKGIVLGWTVNQSEWETAVQSALSAPYIVQQRVPLPREPFPSFHNGNLVVIERMLDTNPFVTFSEKVDGVLTRISTEALLNVTAGGGSTVPTFVIESR
jgi:hypothetical protein